MFVFQCYVHVVVHVISGAEGRAVLGSPMAVLVQGLGWSTAQPMRESERRRESPW